MTALPRLLLLTDRSQLHLGRSLRRTLLECLEAGATHIVLRELDEPDSVRSALAAALADAGATVIAAHRPLVAAAGLHLPSAHALSSERAAVVPRVRSSGGVAGIAERSLVGESCHSVADVNEAAAAGAAYVTLSPYAATASKPGYGPPLPASAFAEAASVGIPVFALGGISPANAAEAVSSGAHGVAVMGEVMRAADPAAVVSALLAALAAAAAPNGPAPAPAAGALPEPVR